MLNLRFRFFISISCISLQSHNSHYLDSYSYSL